MGRGHEFGTLLGAAKRLAADDRVIFLFIGDGAKRGEVEAASRDLPNVRLLPYQRRENLPYSMGAASVCAVTLSDGLEGLLVPSKLYAALAGSKPVLFIGPEASETARIVKEEDCGAALRHGDVDGVVSFVQRLANDAGASRALGENGRRAFDRRFSRTIATARFAEICRDVVEGTAG
jgi:glycosyltransferase involved in cell wall biosynthesis